MWGYLEGRGLSRVAVRGFDFPLPPPPRMHDHGEVPEWSKGTDLGSVDGVLSKAHPSVGSNPTLSALFKP